MFGLFNFWNLAASSTPTSRNRRTVESPEGNASIENFGSDENSNIVHSDNNESSAQQDSDMNGSTPNTSTVNVSTSGSSSRAAGGTPDSPPVLRTGRNNGTNGLGRRVGERDWESVRFASPPRIIRARFSPAPGANPRRPVDSINLSDSDNTSPPRPRTPVAFIDLSTPENPRRRALFARRSNNQERVPMAPPGPVVASTPSSSSNNSSTDDVYRCPVCFESVRGREPASTECGHVFCHACIVAAVRATKKCPLCNEKLTLRRIFRIYF
ncbi:E3 ubiquitin-protein ligase COP1-like [Drosophila montana]|uniref:E3 ubiquitin-protein ligase COP1-like n=1 Tax=Drosophila montana TaxID=40370 RepID=UPI00313BD646